MFLKIYCEFKIVSSGLMQIFFRLLIVLFVGTGRGNLEDQISFQ